MNDYLTWGAMIGALGAIIASVKFWMDLGSAQQKSASDAAQARLDVANLKEDVKAVRDEASQARTVAAMAAGKNDLLLTELHGIQLKFAQEYVSHNALTATEERMACAVESVKRELTTVNDRLYQILDRLSVKT